MCIFLRNSYVGPIRVNSLAPGKFEWNLSYVIFKQILVIDGWRISSEIALIWMSLDFADDQSTLVQVMAWCRHTTSHYLSQSWPRSLSPYGVTRPQWVNFRWRVFYFLGLLSQFCEEILQSIYDKHVCVAHFWFTLHTWGKHIYTCFLLTLTSFAITPITQTVMYIQPLHHATPLHLASVSTLRNNSCRY